MIRALFLGRVMGGSFPIVNLIFYFSTISMIYLYFKKLSIIFTVISIIITRINMEKRFVYCTIVWEKNGKVWFDSQFMDESSNLFGP